MTYFGLFGGPGLWLQTRGRQEGLLQPLPGQGVEEEVGLSKGSEYIYTYIDTNSIYAYGIYVYMYASRLSLYIYTHIYTYKGCYTDV